MSLGIIIKGPEGIVLAAESRITLTASPGAGPPISVSYDNVQKVLEFSSPHTYVGAVTYGAGGIGLRSAFSYITEFEANLGNERLSIENFAKKLSDFYEQQWKSTMPSDYSGPDMTFVVAGYNQTEPYGRVYSVEIPRNPSPKQTSGVDDFGLTWGGQREIVDRLLVGYDPRTIELARRTLALNDEQVKKLGEALKVFGLLLPVQILPLQDCVDLAVFFIRSTIEAQRLTVGLRGVGGPIDVATITRTKGFTWVQKKKLRGEVPTGFYSQPT